jgi:hypothetical protein
MTQHPNPMLGALLARLATKLAAADSSRDLAQHINGEQVAADLGLVRLTAGRETVVGFTPQDRRTAVEAAQRLNEIVFDGPDAPNLDSFPPDTFSLEHNVAALAVAAGRWLERAGDMLRNPIL